jgi:hypothetical protein
VEHLPLGIDHEGRRLLFVEGAKSLEAPSRLPETHELGDDVHDVVSGSNVLYGDFSPVHRRHGSPACLRHLGGAISEIPAGRHLGGTISEIPVGRHLGGTISEIPAGHHQGGATSGVNPT